MRATATSRWAGPSYPVKSMPCAFCLIEARQSTGITELRPWKERGERFSSTARRRSSRGRRLLSCFDSPVTARKVSVLPTSPRSSCRSVQIDP